MRPFIVSLSVVGLLMGAACRDAASPATDRVPAAAPAPPAVTPDVLSQRRESKGARPRIVFLGDSLTAGLGLPADSSYPALLQRRLDEQGYRYEVVNAGVSGDTSAGGLRRLDWSIEGDVKILVVALGANDGLRGLSPDAMKQNLSAILERAASKGLAVILAGMEAPPNNGADNERTLGRWLRSPPMLDFALPNNSALRGRSVDPSKHGGQDLSPKAEFNFPLGTRAIKPPAMWSAGAFQ